jgi:hydrogenase maturation protease
MVGDKMILIIGYGDLLRSDDGVGQRIVASLSYRIQHPEVGFIACHQLMPELADPVSSARHVVFVDASMGGTPGHIQFHSIDPLPTTAAFTHHLTPEGLLALARNWYGTSPHSTMITLCGEHFGYGELLSPSLNAVLPALLHYMQQGIEMMLQVECEAGY